MIKLVSVGASALLLISCSKSGDSSSRADTSFPPPASVSSNPAAAPAKTADTCPHNGKWALCSIERRLKQSGFVVRKTDSAAVTRAGFSIKPTVYSLGQSRLEVFLYKDSTAMKKDIAKLDTLVAGPRGAPSQWGDTPPVLIRSANLSAVILSSSPRQLERAVLAITAGPPQPGSPR